MAAALFPMFVKLAGRHCLVVGAGAVGETKIAALLAAGARVTVIAPEATAFVRELAEERKIEWTARHFQNGDLAGIFLVIAATSKVEVNRAVHIEAQARGVLCNAVDDPPNCDFYFPAVVRRGDLQIAISTAGQSPALAQRLRRELEQHFDDATADWVRLLGELRREIIATHPPSEERKKLLVKLAHSERSALRGLRTLELDLDQPTNVCATEPEP